MIGEEFLAASGLAALEDQTEEADIRVVTWSRGRLEPIHVIRIERMQVRY